MRLLVHNKRLTSIYTCRYPGYQRRSLWSLQHYNIISRSFSSHLSHSPSFVGQYIARDKNLKIMILDPKQDETVWKEYVSGLQKAYAMHDIHSIQCEKVPNQKKKAFLTC